ncbi:unnamed protein product [Urochloa humidicola]
MAHSAFILLLLVPVLASSAAMGNASFDLHAELNHPYAGRPISKYEMIRYAASSSKARRAWNAARVAKACGRGTISVADVPINPLQTIHTLTVGIGTPPQQHTLIIDTGSDLVWAQCNLFPGTAPQKEPLYDPTKSSSFAAIPCDGKLCQEEYFDTKSCPNNKCLYTYGYGSATTDGELASEIFTFGAHRKVSVPLGFGCGRLLTGEISNTSGLLGLSPQELSLVSQLQIPRFSYCLTPFTDRKSSHIFFGAMADLTKYRTIGPIQTTSILNNKIGGNLYYYVPMIGISLGTKHLNVPASSFAIGPDGNGGTIVDSGYTTGGLPSRARKALKEALVGAIKLPMLNSSDPDYDFCFRLPRGVPMEAVQTPPLLYHFEGGATMVLPRDSYLAEPSPGEMCLVIVVDDKHTVVGNYQQQNMHLLFDVQNQKFSFVPTQCDQI